jgi:hypothetical protein
MPAVIVLDKTRALSFVISRFDAGVPAEFTRHAEAHATLEGPEPARATVLTTWREAFERFLAAATDPVVVPAAA